MTLKNTADITSHLPNAPLVEVVFELRWNLEGDVLTPKPFRNDPGYFILVDNFTTAASRHSLKIKETVTKDDMRIAHSVALRFYKNEEQTFPMWQIGPGIFASNESATYEWKSYKKFTLDGAKILLNSYPKMKNFTLKPNILQLKYIDSFDSSSISHHNAIRFINEQTSLNIELPKFLTEKPLRATHSIDLVFVFPIAKMKDTYFRVRIADARVRDKKTIILESKFITKSDAIKAGRTVTDRVKYIENWLEKAHAVTSPFFKQFINESMMTKFRSTP